MKCPYCSRDMVKGSMSQTKLFSPLTWWPDDREIGFKAFFLKQEIKLTSNTNPYLTVYHCEDCRKFVIDQETIET